MISDFSSIIFDYKPYDACDLVELGPPVLPWQFEVLPKFGRELVPSEFVNLKEIIENMSDNEELSKARAKARSEAWMYEGLCAANVCDYIVKTVDRM